MHRSLPGFLDMLRINELLVMSFLWTADPLHTFLHTLQLYERLLSFFLSFCILKWIKRQLHWWQRAEFLLSAEVHHPMERSISGVQMERMIVLRICGVKAERGGDSYSRWAVILVLDSVCVHSGKALLAHLLTYTSNDSVSGLGWSLASFYRSLYFPYTSPPSPVSS